MSFGQRLKQLRNDFNITQEELANKISKTRSTIAGYETERKEPDYDTLTLLADFFDVTVDYLLGRTNDKNSNSSTLTEKDEKDIAKTMEKLKNKLADEEGLMFDGEPLDEETARLLMEAIESQERMVKVINKKYIPKKHRKE